MHDRLDRLAPYPRSASRRRVLALTATSLALLAPGCVSIEDPVTGVDTDVGDSSGRVDDGSDGADTTASGPCVELHQSDVDVDLELEAGCYEVNTLLFVDSATVAMGPGVHVTFGAFGGIYIAQSGVLSAVGTADDPVLLRGATQDRGTWQGIALQGAASSSNRLEHVELRHAGAGSSGSPAVSLSSGSRLTVVDSTFADNAGFALSAEGSELTITGSTLATNRAALSVGADAVPGIGDDNVFDGNDEEFVVVNHGTVSRDATWRAVGVPFRPVGNLVVNAALTLAPGVTVAMPKDASIRVSTEGELSAIGTDASPVTLTGQQSEVGYWTGLSVESNASSNVLEHCVVEYGGALRWTGNNDTRATIFQPGQSKLVVRDSTIRHSGWYGVYADRHSDISGFERNHLEGNERAMVVHPNLAGFVAPTNTFTGNADQRVRVGVLGTNHIVTAQSWAALEVPYHVVEGVTIDAAWTIEAGATIEMAQDRALVVEDGGSVTAIGTADAPVVFTGADSVTGFWKGLQVSTLSSANRLEHASIEYAGSSRWTGAGDTEAALFLGGSAAGSVTLANSAIRNSGGNGILVSANSSSTCSGVSFEGIAKLDVAGPGAGPC